MPHAGLFQEKVLIYIIDNFFPDFLLTTFKFIIDTYFRTMLLTTFKFIIGFMPLFKQRMNIRLGTLVV